MKMNNRIVNAALSGEVRYSHGKKIVILGAGESGTGAAVLAHKQGFDVFVSDLSTIQAAYRDRLESRRIPYEENQHTESILLAADVIIKSPGIPDTAPVIQQIRARNIPILSEIEFAGRYTDAQMIGITGSNGKTTTTKLMYHILQKAGLDVGLAGNVGDSLALQVAETPHDYYVVELSSFQLDNMYDFKVDIAILLNITPDHLDRYDYVMQNYVDAKFRILQNQTSKDALIYWHDDPIIQSELAKHRPNATLYPFAIVGDCQQTFTTSPFGDSSLSSFGGGCTSAASSPPFGGGCTSAASIYGAYCSHKQLTFTTPSGTFTIPQDDLALKGIHNLHNALAAGIAAKILHVPDAVIRQSFNDFAAVEHRLEPVACVNGVAYINDSKATNVNSCRYALQSVDSPIVLILGGVDKGNDYTEIEPLVMEKVRALVLLGVDNHKLHAFFDGKVESITDARSMHEAVGQASQLAQPGDTVLLSPCCASFDLFQNYEDRGRQFKQEVPISQ